ncbi:MAG: PQQ-binding-like beta-propeller repeat protein [Candidatus Omnitrophota bacterium]|nr:PQQ-binding-like beta-propeller repeat protein [Candidatus Omnitrophota bacterium]
MWKYDLGRTGSYPNGPTIFPLKLKWTYNTGTYLSQPPIIANNVAYIYGYGNGKLLAINATTGLLKWSYSQATYEYLDDKTPTVAGGVLYVTGVASVDNGATYPNVLFAFDANTGVLKWKYDTKNRTSADYSNVAVFNNVAYVPIGTKLYALDAITGTLKWVYASPSQFGFTTHCAISNGVVYVGDGWSSSLGNYNVCALDAVTGVLKWRYIIPEVNKHVSGISIANGMVYFGTEGNGTRDGALCALDANTGSLKWKNTNHIDVNMVAVADGIVYANVNNGGRGLQAFDANTGAIKWSTPSYAGIGISNGLAFVSGSYFTVLDAKTGALKWNYTYFSTFGFGEPFIYNGNVYVCENSSLYCFGQ